MKLVKKIFVAALLLGSQSAFAKSPSELVYGVDNYSLAVALLLSILAFVFVAILVVAFVLYFILNQHLNKETKGSEAVAESSFWEELWDKFNALKPIAQEEKLTLSHNYDGIQELDNDLPPWWKYGFYLTIVFSFVYLYIYHYDTKTDDAASIVEYKAELVSAEIAKKEYLSKMANQMDESNVELADNSGVTSGQAIFTQNCKACHGASGEGGVGPNLTDEYWLHGGDLKAIFKTIKYGVPQNGMLPWKDKLNPKQMQEVSSYILSLAGTNPPNGKAPQGEKFVPQQQ